MKGRFYFKSCSLIHVFFLGRFEGMESFVLIYGMQCYSSFISLPIIALLSFNLQQLSFGCVYYLGNDDIGGVFFSFLSFLFLGMN
jgi:hypothetical protein